MELTPKQQAFVNEYLKDRNGKQAAIRAGYSPKTANEQASRLLTNVNVADAVKSKSKKIADKAEITAEWVLKELKKQYQSASDSDEKQYALKALELMGKHTGVGAFKDKLELSGSLTLTHEQMLDELE